MAFVFVTVLIDLLGFGIVIPLLPVYSEAYGASGTTLAWLFASFSGMQFLFAPMWGRVSDRYGRRPVLIGGLVGTSFSYVLFALADSMPMLFFSRILAGFFGANVSTAQAYVADVTAPKDRAKGMGMIGAAFGLGFTLGPWIGGEMTAVSPRMPGFFAAGLSLTAALFGYLKVPEPRTHTKDASRVFGFDQLRTVLSEGRVGTLYLLFFLGIFSFASFESMFTLFGLAVFPEVFNLPAAVEEPTREQVLAAAPIVGRYMGLIGIMAAIIQGGLIRRAGAALRRDEAGDRGAVPARPVAADHRHGHELVGGDRRLCAHAVRVRHQQPLAQQPGLALDSPGPAGRLPGVEPVPRQPGAHDRTVVGGRALRPQRAVEPLRRRGRDPVRGHRDRVRVPSPLRRELRGRDLMSARFRFRPRVFRVDGDPPPAEALAALREHDRPVLLDSAAGRPQRFSLLALDPLPSPAPRAAGSALRAWAAHLGPDGGDDVPGPFHGGFVGALSYDLGVDGERAVEVAPEPWGQPPIVGGSYVDFLVRDEGEGNTWLVLGEEPGDGRAPVDQRRARILEELSAAPRSEGAVPSGAGGVRAPRRCISSEEHRRRIERTRDYIARGDIYQANLAHRFTCAAPGDPVDWYLRLRAVNPAPYMGFARWDEGGGGALLSASPELLFEFDGAPGALAADQGHGAALEAIPSATASWRGPCSRARRTAPSW